MILGNKDIREYLDSGKLVISPLSEDTIRENGVDLRIGNEILRFVDTTQEVDINDKDSLEKIYKKETIKSSFVLNPNERLLIKIKEHIKMPNDLVGLANVRSTFARLGISIPPTVADAGFEGDLTILVVGGNMPVRIEPDTRFLHLVLVKTKSEVTKPYAGKYQKSGGATGAKV
jgi:dCTP deaminase